MTITTAYLTDVKSDIKTNIAAEFTYIGFGTGNTAASPSDTALVAQIVRNARQDSTTASSSVTVSGYLNASTGNGSTIRESGVFDASSGGNLKSRIVLATPVVKTSDKEFWIDYTTTVNVTQS